MADRYKIFIVDDDEVVLTSLRKLLTVSGFDVATVSSAKEAMSSIKKYKPDLILLDLLMPSLGGMEICELLNSDNELSGTPIIIISAISNPQDIKRSYSLGVVGYVTKPYEFPQLLNEINKAISNKKSTA